MSFFISKELEGIVTREMLYNEDDDARLSIVNSTQNSVKKFDFLEYQPQKNKLKLSCRNSPLSKVLTFLNEHDDYSINFFSNKKANQKILINKIKSHEDKIIVHLKLL
jgi:hypothetical protein